MANCIKPIITFDIGTVILGKYTFPKISALLEKMLDVDVIHKAK